MDDGVVVFSASVLHKGGSLSVDYSSTTRYNLKDWILNLCILYSPFEVVTIFDAQMRLNLFSICAVTVP